MTDRDPWPCGMRHDGEHRPVATHSAWFVRPCGHDCTRHEVCDSCAARLQERGRAERTSVCGECGERSEVRILEVQTIPF